MQGYEDLIATKYFPNWTYTDRNTFRNLLVNDKNSDLFSKLNVCRCHMGTHQKLCFNKILLLNYFLQYLIKVKSLYFHLEYTYWVDTRTTSFWALQFSCCLPLAWSWLLMLLVYFTKTQKYLSEVNCSIIWSHRTQQFWSIK